MCIKNTFRMSAKNENVSVSFIIPEPQKKIEGIKRIAIARFL